MADFFCNLGAKFQLRESLCLGGGKNLPYHHPEIVPMQEAIASQEHSVPLLTKRRHPTLYPSTGKDKPWRRIRRDLLRSDEKISLRKSELTAVIKGSKEGEKYTRVRNSLAKIGWEEIDKILPFRVAISQRGNESISKNHKEATSSDKLT